MGRVLHFDCFSGLSGDMTVAALIDLGVPEAVLQDAVNSLGLEGTMKVEKVRKNGFAATHIKVEIPPAHKHRHLSHILKIIDAGAFKESAKNIARAMFQKLGEAEAHSHGIPIEKVHFHEVGAVDSIFDFVAVAVGIDHLAPDRITSAPVPTGTGFIDCDHGRLPVPPPAVAKLLTGIPMAPSTIETELTTPTGAAIVATLATSFGPVPPMTIEKIGIGAGTKDFKEQPNILRLILGQEAATTTDSGLATDQVWQIETNLDDVSPEIIGYAFDRLFDAGALDVFTIPIHMKKNRPGVLMSVLCSPEKLADIERILFHETGSFGLRKRLLERSKLQRQFTEVDTPWGKVRGKLGWSDSLRLFTPEHDDCARIAREHNLPLRDVFSMAVRCFAGNNDRTSP